MYDKLLPKLGDAVWHDGQWTMKTVEGSDAWKMLAWTWELNNQGVLVVISFSDSSASGQIKLNVPSGTITFTDILTGTAYPRDGNEVKNTGLWVVIGAWNAQIFYYNK